MLLDAAPSVRRDLAAATRQAHVALHGHPWISLLSGPALTRDSYAVLMRAYRQFYHGVEERRRTVGFFDDLSLASAVAALGEDLKELKRAKITSAPPTLPGFSTAPAILGGLYVLHGARFGAATLKGNVSAILPDAPVHFLGSPMPARLWRDLIDRLERTGQGASTRTAIIDAANATFGAFGDYVTACCMADGLSKGPDDKDETEDKHAPLHQTRQPGPDTHAERQQNRNQQA